MPNQRREAIQARDDITGEHTFGDAGQILFACLFGVVWIADTFFLKYTTFPSRYLPWAARVVPGVVLAALSGFLTRTGLSIVFGEEREEPEVIRKSVFGIVRHPIYLSEILLYLAFLMFSTSLAAAFVCLCAIGFLHYISRYEERLLLARFGEEYEQYMRDVPMWIPRLRRKGSGTRWH